MIYLVAVFIPPLYFLLNKRWFAFVAHSVVSLVAIVLCMTVVLALLGVPLYCVSSACAVWHLRRRLMDEHATMIASRMAEAISRA